ncbi:uncharacterized protein LOC134296406 isoform X2 [Anolis carolinensis]|uniref:uncharacterized protein LOC134296406 isoform X2 n=1 Tax=Anolis carolinensis TaxID=28377 RepID=UPI002F2B892E
MQRTRTKRLLRRETSTGPTRPWGPGRRGVKGGREGPLALLVSLAHSLFFFLLLFESCEGDPQGGSRVPAMAPGGQRSGEGHLQPAGAAPQNLQAPDSALQLQEGCGGAGIWLPAFLREPYPSAKKGVLRISLLFQLLHIGWHPDSLGKTWMLQTAWFSHPHNDASSSLINVQRALQAGPAGAAPHRCPSSRGPFARLPWDGHEHVAQKGWDQAHTIPPHEPQKHRGGFCGSSKVSP